MSHNQLELINVPKKTELLLIIRLIFSYFFFLSTQHLAGITTGTGIFFQIIFYIGTKEAALRPLRKISSLMDPAVSQNPS